MIADCLAEFEGMGKDEVRKLRREKFLAIGSKL